MNPPIEMDIKRDFTSIVIARPETRINMNEKAFSAELEHACELDTSETVLQT